MADIEKGDNAPDFTLPADDGSTVSLAGLRGKKVVLYFYPKDDTPGCTTQACDLRDEMPRLDAMDVVVLGVSPDSVKSHRKFKQKFDLNFPLLADEDHAVAEAYGVWKEKHNYGIKALGIVRSTFLIDERGKVIDVWRKVKAAEHAAWVAEKLGA
jgi:peroxiredoxin Q/BCP